MNSLAFIPARGGSKRLPGKNIKLLGGKPLIAWTIEAALKSKQIKQVIVSTDDTRIAAVARRYGAEVPFMRPARLAQDASTHIAVVVHALQQLKQETPSYVMLLQPTSPLRSAQDIDGAVALALKRKADAVVGVHEMPVHPFLARTLTKQGTLKKMIQDRLRYRRKQSLPLVYAPNGSLYLIRTDVLLRQQTFFPKKTYPWVMPPQRSLDVDTPWDFELVDLIFKNKKKILK